MTVETYGGVAAQVMTIEKLSPAEKLGLLPGDVILKLGMREPLEAIESPSMLAEIASEREWMVVRREAIIFRIALKGGAAGADLQPYPLPEDVTVKVEHGWFQFHSAMRPGEAMILLPEQIAFIWWFVPLIAYGYFRLWQMMAAMVFIYGIGLAMGWIAFAVVYAASVLSLAAGGAALLRDAAYKDGFVPRGRVAVASKSDVAALEILTGAILRLERDNLIARRRPKK